ncbi:MAG: hypothetical protein HQ501_14010 [Rhodospirillales bacterium]|nr:hypothetical protein [Rhodospirillales bacterium]
MLNFIPFFHRVVGGLWEATGEVGVNMGRLVRQTDPVHWTYDIYTNETPADELGDFAQFKRLWDSKRNGDGLPAWRDFNLEDFVDWYGWISVEDIIPGPTYDSVFRLWGINLAEYYGKDLTNKRMSEFLGDLFAPEDFEFLQNLHGTHNFTISWGPVKWQTPEIWRYSKRYSVIELPLADDGQTVDRFISLVLPIETPAKPPAETE